jgi:prepilin-type N-terminal cleavage/methylation domain-containing protein
MKRFGSRGFTILEVLVALSIIIVLATVVYISANDARAKARDTQRISDLEQIRIALRLYAEQHGAYPFGNGFLGVGGSIDSELAPFLPNVPQDPRHDGSTFGYFYDDWVLCNGERHIVLYAISMEGENARNGADTGCADLAGADTARTVIVALSPSS